MKWIRVFCLISILVFVTNSVFIIFAGQSKYLTADNELVSEDFSISGLYLGDSLTKASKIFRKPKKIQRGKYSITYYFSDVNVKQYIFENGTEKVVHEINVISNKVSTYRGIRIGDPEEKVFSRYGRTDKIEDTLLYELHLDLAYMISFTISKGKVKDISLYLPED